MVYHGEGIGGNVIDLVCKVLKCSIKEALSFLKDESFCFSFQQQQLFIKKEEAIQIVKVQEIRHPALIQYLSSREISLTIAKTFCKEVWYKYKDTQFFAIGLMNHKNGWELRNKFFKNSSSPKAYTYIQNDNKELVIVEGMFDLLSLVTKNETQIKENDIMILNSIAFIKDVEINITKYESVQLYLDNDKAGQQATKYLMNNYKNVIDQSSIYKNHKDLNDLLCHEKER